MKSLGPLLLTLLLLSGCAGINDALVRQWFRDPGLSHKVKDQILEGLEIRKSKAPSELPSIPAPAFLDQG
jgi:hypothetical protein